MVLLKVGFVRYCRVRIDGPGPLAGVLNDRVWGCSTLLFKI